MESLMIEVSFSEMFPADAAQHVKGLKGHLKQFAPEAEILPGDADPDAMGSETTIFLIVEGTIVIAHALIAINAYREMKRLEHLTLRLREREEGSDEAEE